MRCSSLHEIKKNSLIALVGALWITLFLVFVGPFDTGILTLKWRVQVMGGYGLIFAISYFLSIPLQHWFYAGSLKLRVEKEAAIFGFVFSLNLLGSYLYYQSEIINGDYDFLKFVVVIYLPSLAIFLPLLALLRWLFFKSEHPRETVKKSLSERTDLEGLKPKIQQLMDAEVYLDSTMTLQKMAGMLGVNNSVLSQAINQGYGQNFNDFINHYRIEAVLQCLKNGQHKTLTITGISENCGFNSRATFNRAFKKRLQMTPGEYIRSIR